MSRAAIGPFRFRSFTGGLEDLAAGREAPDALRNLDELLPQPNSLRRAGVETKAAVLTAAELLRAEGLAITERTGLYVGNQQISLSYCSEFINASYTLGPRLASPMLFSESVANNAATHLSLTLGLRASAQTFIGTRVAGIQALLAAVEDVEDGLIDTGLVVVLGVSTELTRDAYRAVFCRRGGGEMRALQGAVAMLVRRQAEGQPRLAFGAVRCAGEGEADQRRAVASLWSDWKAIGLGEAPVSASVFTLVRDRSLAVLREGGRKISEQAQLPESFALDPFARLLLDSLPGTAAPRALLCLGEEGTAAMLALDGAARSVRI